MTSPTTERSSTTTGHITRRRALSGAATVGLSLPLLSACGDESSAPSASSTPEASDPTATESETATESPTSSESEDATPDSLTPTADIPVGSGVIFADSRVVVTQPEAGDFKCFSAVCTHTGCILAGVTSTIVCQCHGSSFDLATGEVLGGPAGAPLPSVDFTIEDDQVVLA